MTRVADARERRRYGARMGAWGTGNFDNDDALDWLGDLGDVESLRSALQTVASAHADAWVEAPDCCAALAAAEIVAASRGAAAGDLPEHAVAWVERHGRRCTPHDAALAAAAAARIVAASELQELFDDSPSKNEWHSVVNALRDRLTSASR